MRYRLLPAAALYLCCMIDCICINDKDKPAQIPDSMWVKEGQPYTIVNITRHPAQQGIKGCELAEISLDESCAPYEMYKLGRFGFKPEDIERLIEFMHECTDLDKLDIVKLLEEEHILEPR